MTFTKLNLIEPLLKAVAFEGYETPTPIQAQAIPHILKGKDLLGIAQTGTGKTAAFVLPILQLLSAKKKRLIRGTPRALILAPTRELAAQIDASIKKYGHFLDIKHTVIYGGVGQGPQVQKLTRGIDILVATPGRLLDLMDQRHINLRSVECFVLDEADRMLDMGFIRDIRKIVPLLPKERQTIFFSATMSPEVNKLASTLLSHPARVSITPHATTVETVDQRVLFVDQKEKDALLLDLLKQKHLERVLIFARTKHGANKLALRLTKRGIKSGAIHGDKTQNARMLALKNFRTGRTKVLVATDVAARGIDIEKISHVINYDLPNEPEAYIHRIGRTARAGEKGTAYSFCCATDRDSLRFIEKIVRMPIPVMQHAFHSDEAQNATGAAARPPPKKQGARGASGRKHAPRKTGSRTQGPRKGPGARGSGRPGARAKGRAPRTFSQDRSFRGKRTRDGPRGKPTRTKHDSPRGKPTRMKRDGGKPPRKPDGHGKRVREKRDTPRGKPARSDTMSRGLKKRMSGRGRKLIGRRARPTRR